jgi:hypothetical protein
MASIDISLAQFVLQVLDKPGGIKFNTNMVSHGGMRDDISVSKQQNLENKEIMTIGSPDKPLNIQDMMNFLNKLKKHVENKAFDSGRTYWFEGIDGADDEYEILWGS